MSATAQTVPAKLARLSPDDAEDAETFLKNIAEDLDSVRDSIDAVERLVPAFAGSMPPLSDRVRALAVEVAALLVLAKAGRAPAAEGAA